MAHPRAPAQDTDAVVVGAGPVGLWQVFQLGLQGLRSTLIDVLPNLGGQCSELYPDKPIYDIPGIAACDARELVERLTAQIAPFAPAIRLGRRVDRLTGRPDGRFDVETDDPDTRFTARVVVVAAGVGAFSPKRLRVDGLEAHEGRQVFYANDDPRRAAGQRVIVIGDGQAALDAAIELCSAAEDTSLRAQRLTLLHRRDEFRAASPTLARLHELRASGHIQFLAAQPTAVRESPAGRLTALQVLDAQGETRWIEFDLLLACTGLSPRLGPIADWGLGLDRKQIVVDTARFQTTTKGIFAVGDIVTYPGKRKLIVCGFHEATLAAFAAAEHLRPGQPIHLEYTTTSPRLHRLLGVTPPTTNGDA